MRIRSMQWSTCVFVLVLVSVAHAAPSKTQQTICVEVNLKQSESNAASEGPPLVAPRADVSLPLGEQPITYLKRLLEYFVSHESGYVAVDKNCNERIVVELYPLLNGWTAFARYSGTGREERIDQLLTDELSQFAERAVLALLYGKTIATTIKRDTVLRADSKRAAQRVRGTNHFVLGLGTQLRVGLFPTVASSGGGSVDKIRAFSPISLDLGYRGKFESWGLEALFALAIGTSKSGLNENTLGGHVDYGGNVSFAVHFMRYLQPRGLTSVFLGGGGSFEVMWLYQVRPLSERGDDRRTLPSGGFNVDLLAGVEFMRASKVQFSLELALMLPAYVVENGDGARAISTWLPGAGLHLAMLF